MAVSLVDRFYDLELNDLDDDLEVVILGHDDLDFFSILYISSPFLNHL